MAVIGKLLVDLEANVARLQGDMNRAANVVERASRQMQRSMRRFGNLLTGGLGVAVFLRGMQQIINATREAEQSENRLTAVIRAQGHAAGFTRDQLEAMNSQLAQTTQFDDESIRNGQAQLLKFGNIYGDVFTRAMNASADLAAFQGTELSAGIDAWGKALQNPVKGIRLIQQQLGKFDPAQLKMLENMVQQNRVMEAQNLLLDIGQKKIGGTAELMNTGYTKAASDAKKAWNEFLESLGKSEGPFLSVVSSLNAITNALKFLQDVLTPDAPSIVQEKVVKNLEKRLNLARGRQGRTDDSGRALTQSEWDAYIRGLEEQIKWARRDLDQLRQQELRQLLGDDKAKPAPKPKIDSGPLKGKGGGIGEHNRNLLGIGEHNRNLMGIGPEFFAQAQLGQAFGAVDLERQIELVTRANEVMRMKAEGEAFGAEQLGIYRDAQRAAVDSVEVYIKSIDSETRLMGTTTAGRQRLLDIMRLEDEQRDLNAKGTGFAAEEYERLIGKLRAARDAQDALNHSWAFGAGNALAQYQETVENVASSTESLITDAFRGMEDALVRFVQTGKLSFTDMANSIVADLIRIQIQQSITGPLAGFIGDLIPSVGGGGTVSGPDINAIFPPGRAAGGPVSAGMPYWVGEEGRELFVPRSSGSIVPNGQAGKGDTYIIDARGADQSGLARLEAMILALNGSIEKRAVLANQKEFSRRPSAVPR